MLPKQLRTELTVRILVLMRHFSFWVLIHMENNLFFQLKKIKYVVKVVYEETNGVRECFEKAHAISCHAERSWLTGLNNEKAPYSGGCAPWPSDVQYNRILDKEGTKSLSVLLIRRADTNYALKICQSKQETKAYIVLTVSAYYGMIMTSFAGSGLFLFTSVSSCSFLTLYQLFMETGGRRKN